jgi:ABC-2 type transport system permease protein
MGRRAARRPRAYQGGRRPLVLPPYTSNKPKTVGFVPQSSLRRLTVGLIFSTIAKTQLQAMQMGFFFFLPSLLLSGFMFPFRGMPAWAQALGELLPLTHFLRVVRGILLKGYNLAEVVPHVWPLVLFIGVVLAIRLKRFRQMLD